MDGFNAQEKFGYRLTRGLFPDDWLLVGKLKKRVGGEEARKSMGIVGINGVK